MQEVEDLVGSTVDQVESVEGKGPPGAITNQPLKAGPVGGFDPDVSAQTELSTEVLKDSVQQYLFISTLSVFANDGVVGQDENGVLGEYDEAADEVVTGSAYGIFNTCSPPSPWARCWRKFGTGLARMPLSPGYPRTFSTNTEVLRELDSLGGTLVRNPDYAGYNQYNVDRAVAAGLTFRPIGVTSKDTVDWYKATPEDERSGGRLLTPEREAEVREPF